MAAQAGLPDDIFRATVQDDVPAVRAWLDEGHDVNTTGDNGQSFLHIAAMRSPNVVRLLLARGADPNLVTTDERVKCGPQYNAALNAMLRPPTSQEEEARVIEIIDNLLSRGAKPDIGHCEDIRLLAVFVGYSSGVQANPARITTSFRLAITARLLRAGASLDNCFRGEPVEASIRYTEDHLDVANDASFAAGKAFIIRAAGLLARACDWPRTFVFWSERYARERWRALRRTGQHTGSS